MLKIVDYGVGNILAFKNVYRRVGIPCESAGTPDEIRTATKLILPGVGAFDHAMTKFNESGLREAVEQKVIEHNCPILGICVGMQMLGDSSEEGSLAGLGWIPGRIQRFQPSLDVIVQVPHMGWNTLSDCRHETLFNGLNDAPDFYFLHSYYYEPDDNNDSAAFCEYGKKFTAVVARNNILGVQFHPEKSHSNGHLLLKNFAEFNA